MYEKRWTYKETSLQIKSDSKRGIKAAIDDALKARRQLERFLFRNPNFRHSLDPVESESDQRSDVVRRMIMASKLSGVGPFAAVAGTISQIAAEAGVKAGAKNILVDNDGDIAIIGDREFRVGIFAGESTISGRVYFLLRPADLPVGICTSSGTVGHSTSFGDSDAVTVITDDAATADAATTAVANEVIGEEVKQSIERGLEKASSIRGIRGCLIARRERVGMFGKLPEIRGWNSGKISSDPYEDPSKIYL